MKSDSGYQLDEISCAYRFLADVEDENPHIDPVEVPASFNPEDALVECIDHGYPAAQLIGNLDGLMPNDASASDTPQSAGRPLFALFRLMDVRDKELICRDYGWEPGLSDEMLHFVMRQIAFSINLGVLEYRLNEKYAAAQRKEARDAMKAMQAGDIEDDPPPAGFVGMRRMHRPAAVRAAAQLKSHLRSLEARIR